MRQAKMDEYLGMKNGKQPREKKEQKMQRKDMNIENKGENRGEKFEQKVIKQKEHHQQAEESVESDLSVKIVQPQKPLVNLLFYTNKMKSEPMGDYIDQIHKNWHGKYQLLQSHHGFIQWLFPNAFQSRFNNKSSPLLPAEEKQFRQNIEIAKRYVTSYMIMLQFYGMKIKNKRTGQILRSRKPDYRERYQKTLLISFHNHMRITRMLSSLVMVGFGRYAKQLSLFLKSQIYSNQGEMKSLRRYGIYQREWEEYSEFKEKQEDLNIFLRELDKKQGSK